MGLYSEVIGFGFFFFHAAYDSTEMLRFLSEPCKYPVVTVIVPLENTDLLALQSASLLCYFKTHSDLLEADFIGTNSVRDWHPYLTCVRGTGQLLSVDLHLVCSRSFAGRVLWLQRIILFLSFFFPPESPMKYFWRMLKALKGTHLSLDVSLISWFWLEEKCLSSDI